MVQIKGLSVFPTELCKNPENSNRLPFIGRLGFTEADLGTGGGIHLGGPESVLMSLMSEIQCLCRTVKMDLFGFKS